jgi:hypothetical protein
LYKLWLLYSGVSFALLCCSSVGTGCSLGRVISDFAGIVFERVEMQLMKRQKIVIVFFALAFLLSSALAVTYGNLSHSQPTANFTTVEIPTPLTTSLPFQVQVISPVDNYTYGTYDGPHNITSDEAAHETTYSLILPLNITTNQEASRITYSLDGSDNITFNENTTATLTLNYGVHSLTVYATNIKGIATESNITFTVGYDYPDPINRITMEQAQEAIRYFESRGLKLQVENIPDQSKWQNLVFFLYGGSVDYVSKENFADSVIAHGLDTIYFSEAPSSVSYYVKIYDNSPLPIYYGYSATIV